MQHQRKSIKRHLTDNECITMASFKIALMLAKAQKPFTEAEFMKQCFIEAAQTLFQHYPNQQSFIRQIDNLQLSARTIERRLSELASDICRQTKLVLTEAIAFSIALNETTDISDTAQVVFCYRAVNKSFQIITDVLTLKALHNQTRASDIMDTFEIVKNEFQLDMQKCVSVATDGAPNMIGNNISCHQHIQMT